MNILFLIAARGGSKGVPQKNIKELGGISLLGYKAISANKVSVKKRIIISTDSPEIAQNAKAYGVEVPFLRPEYLATDTASSVDVVLHAMEWVENNDSKTYDLLFLLEPSSPFGTYEDFEKAISMFENPNVENVVGVKEVNPHSTFIVPISDDGSLSLLAKNISGLTEIHRQAFKKEYTPNGTLYCARWNSFKNHKSFYTEKTFPLVQKSEYSVEIDSIDDLWYAEFVVEKKIIDNGYWS